MSEIVKTILSMVHFPEDGTSGLRERINIKTYLNNVSAKDDDETRTIILLNKLFHLFDLSDRYIKLITKTYPLIKSQYQQKETIALLNKQYDECNMEKKFLETVIAEKEREILDLNKQVDKFTTEIEKQKNIINNLEIENNKYEEELKTQIFNLDQLNECEDKIEEKDKQIKELDNRNIEKDKQLTEKDKQITELDYQIKQLNILINSNNTEIKSKNVELNKNLQLCTTQLSEQKQEIKRINEELTQSYRHINEKHQLEETYKNELEKCNYEKHELEKTYMKQLEEQKQAHQRQYKELLSLKTKELEKHQQAEETYKQLQDQMLNKYNELLANINTINNSNNTLFNNFFKKSILSNDDITECFSNILFINNSYSSEKNKLIEEIIIKIIDHFNTEHKNYIQQEHINRMAKLNDIINNSNYNNNDLQPENIANILFTNEEERGLFNHILNSFKTNITDEIVEKHKKELMPYVDLNVVLKRQLQEPNYLAKMLVDELASMDLVKEKIIEQLADLYKYTKETNYEVIKVYTFITIIYTIYQNELKKDFSIRNIKHFYVIILQVIHKSYGDTSKILAIQQMQESENSILKQTNKEMNSKMLVMASELKESKIHLSMINTIDVSSDYDETLVEKFTSIIRTIINELDAYLSEKCRKKYLLLAFDQIKVKEIFCRNSVAKNEMKQLFYSLSNHISKFIFCAQFYKNLVTVINDKILMPSIQLNLYFSQNLYDIDTMKTALLNSQNIKKAIKTPSVFPIIYNIKGLTLIGEKININDDEIYKNQIVSIDNKDNNLKLLTLLNSDDIEQEKKWFIETQIIKKYLNVIGDEIILKTISSQKVSSQETTKTSKTYKTTDSGTKQKDAKQRSKLNTQDRRKNEILTLKKNQRGKQFMNRRGTDGKQLEEEVDINPINDTSSSVEGKE